MILSGSVTLPMEAIRLESLRSLQRQRSLHRQRILKTRILLVVTILATTNH